MRKSLLLVAPPVLLALGYAAWPAWSAWQLRAAVKARDIPGIERKVDWPQLRANLKRTIAANLQDDTKSPTRASSARPSSARSGRSSPIA